MNISKISIANIQPKAVKCNFNPYMSKGLPCDKFEKSNLSFKGADKHFNLEESMNSLKELKTQYGYPKFSESELEAIKTEITTQPKKWNGLNKLATAENTNGPTVKNIATKDLEIVDTLASLVDVKNEKTNKPRFECSDFICFCDKLSTDEIKNLVPFAKTSLDKNNLVELIKNPKINAQKLGKKLVEIEKTFTQSFNSITCKTDKYDKDALAVEIKSNTEKTIELLDKNYNTQTIENVKKQSLQNGKLVEIKKVKDLRNNTVSKTRSEYKNNLYIATNELRLIKNNKGQIIKKEYCDKSEIPGVYNVKYEYPNGKVEIVSEGKIDPKTGIKSIKKDMKSSEGVRTQYLYSDDPQGNKIIDYKITDKKGKTLLNYSQSFEVIDDNTFISSKNGKSYEIKVSDKSLKIKDQQTNKEKEINLAQKISGDKYALIDTLKQMPGEELIALDECTKSLVGISNPLKSVSRPKNKEIQTGGNLFVLLHELGHAKDLKQYDPKNHEETFKKGLFNNKNLLKTFEDEKESFNKAYPNAQRQHIGFFIEGETHYNKEIGGLRETIAESNALLNTYNNTELVAMRSQYLQQHFPRTIANLSNLLYNE